MSELTRTGSRLVVPTIVATGGGGIMQADADEVARLLEAQVETHEAAAAD